MAPTETKKSRTRAAAWAAMIEYARSLPPLRVSGEPIGQSDREAPNDAPAPKVRRKLNIGPVHTRKLTTRGAR